MKKIVFVFCLVFLICGCSSESSKEQGASNVKKPLVVNGSMKCVIDDTEFTLELSDGQIVRYIDSVEGELPQETVDILNEEHLVGVTDNNTAILRMNDGLKDLGGHCE